MNHQGHGLAYTHRVFNVPYPAAFEKTSAPRETHHEGTSPLYPKGMGRTFELVKFEKDKPADGRFNPTLVSHEGFFVDIPGFENIAEGHAPKSLGSLSLARQGRYFYWGYSIDPALLTAGGRSTLINTLYYMYSKRNSITVEYVCETRRSLEVNLELYRQVGYKQGYGEDMYGRVLKSSLQDYEASPAGLEKWLDENLQFVFSGKSEKHKGSGKYEHYGTRFEIDNDAKSLQTPNSLRSSLEKWIELAATGSGERQQKAIRCLERYVHPSLAVHDGDWTSWYARQKNRIAFIESTGFWWQEDPVVLEREADTKRRQTP